MQSKSPEMQFPCFTSNLKRIDHVVFMNLKYVHTEQTTNDDGRSPIDAGDLINLNLLLLKNVLIQVLIVEKRILNDVNIFLATKNE